MKLYERHRDIDVMVSSLGSFSAEFPDGAKVRGDTFPEVCDKIDARLKKKFKRVKAMQLHLVASRDRGEIHEFEVTSIQPDGSFRSKHGSLYGDVYHADADAVSALRELCEKRSALTSQIGAEIARLRRTLRVVTSADVEVPE